MPLPFIGRKKELATFEKLLKKTTSSLVVVKGRRRIGKSRLIQEFAKKYTFYQFSGLPSTPETSIQSQLDVFAKQLSEQTGLPRIQADDWSTMFLLLADKIKTGRIIVLFDEISWMGSKDADFLGKLKNAWDMHFKKNPKLILFLCGSVSSWIDKNILSSTGFVGRISFRLTLDELPLHECNQFWTNKGSLISPYEKFKILSVTGGIPRYLEEIDTSLPADENIKDLCFSSGGMLAHEFHDIFSDIFGPRTNIYKKIVEVLANGPLEPKKISNILGVSYTGTQNDYLEDLVISGFVKRDYTWHFSTGKVSRFSQFRLSDNYVRFYLKYIDPILPKIENNAFDFASLSALPGWDTIKGYQFENLVLKNRRFIIEYLNINPNDIVSDNPFFQRANKEVSGCQIDYLIQTKYRVLFVCEFKFTSKPIGKQVIRDMQEKIQKLSYPKGFSVLPVLVHVNGVEDEITNSGFFAKVIDFSQALMSEQN